MREEKVIEKEEIKGVNKILTLKEIKGFEE